MFVVLRIVDSNKGVEVYSGDEEVEEEGDVEEGLEEEEEEVAAAWAV